MLNTYETTWTKATRVTGNDNRYTYFELNKPDNATSLKVAYFANSVTTMSEDNATAIMSKENRFYVSSKTQPIASFDSSISIVHNNLVEVTDLHSNFVVNICEKGFALITFDTKTFNGFYNIYCYTVID